MNNYIKNPHKFYTVDLVIIGCGIISATLATYIKELLPKYKIHIYERLSQASMESSNGWNNSGTGHAAFCEMNYTSFKKGVININRAVNINLSFNLSLQFWSYLISNKILKNPESFIKNVPHISLVWNKNNVNFLHHRFQALQKSILFHGMKYSEDYEQISKWIPLLINGRSRKTEMAATYMKIGTDVNFGEITKQLINSLKYKKSFSLYLNHEVIDIKKNKDNTWNLKVKNKNDKIINALKLIRASKVFIGCGGGSLNLLQKSQIPEMIKYAGFPISSRFLVTRNPKVVNEHNAKVYGMAKLGNPPMSVPHIDTRFLDGEKVVFFGPFANFNTKFLKYGSWLDFFRSIKIRNLLPMIYVGATNLNLIKYLINQSLMNMNDCISTLCEYYPKAKIKDWDLIDGGQRVQIIKRSSIMRGKLKFGTEVVVSRDRSIFALLGASPGASVSVHITLNIIKSMLEKEIYNFKLEKKISEINPFFNFNGIIKNNDDINRINDIRFNVAKNLNLHFFEIKV